MSGRRKAMERMKRERESVAERERGQQGVLGTQVNCKLFKNGYCAIFSRINKVRILNFLIL